MEILEIAIEREGGVNALAAALDVGQTVVSNWRSRGLPKPWRMVLELKYKPELAHPSAERSSSAIEAEQARA